MEYTTRARGLPSVGTLVRFQGGVIASALILCVGLAAAFLYNQPHTYTSTSVILVSPAPGNPLTPAAASSGVTQMTIALETEAQVVSTPGVAQLVSANLDRDVILTADSLEVSVPSNTQTLRISLTASSPLDAQEGAQAWAESYLEYREQNARTWQESTIERLEQQISVADSDLKAATAEAGSDSTSSYASQQVQLLVDRLAQLGTRLSAEEAVSTFPGSVLTSAELPEGSNGLPRWLLMVVAGVAGLGVGLALALAREWRHDMLRGTVDIETLGFPVLAELNTSRTSRHDLDAQLSERYRQVRTAVVASDHAPQVIAVSEVSSPMATSSSPQAADVAVNLAVTLAEAQFKAAVVVAPGQSTRAMALLGLGPVPGLSEVVRTGAPVPSFIVKTHGISLLPAGDEEGDASGLTASAEFRHTIRELASDYDYVILAAGPAGTAEGDSALLVANSTILVLSPDVVTQSLLVGRVARLERLGVHALGVVLVPTAKRRRHRWVRSSPGRTVDVPGPGAGSEVY